MKHQQELLDRLCAYLRERFSCETAILYGSRARGDWDSKSDIDVIAFGKVNQTGHIAHRWENLFLDLFLYPSGTKPEQDWLRIHDGRVLFQRDAEGDAVLAAVKEVFSSGPETMSPSDAQTTRLWLEKMLARAEKGDAEGDYRRHWLLKEVSRFTSSYEANGISGPRTASLTCRRTSPNILRPSERPSLQMRRWRIFRQS